jgi:hypothetical protein
LEDPSIYLPNLPTYTFLKELSDREGIEELPLRARSQLQLTDLN